MDDHNVAARDQFRVAIAVQAEAERNMREAVRQARRAGLNWVQIAHRIGLREQDVRQINADEDVSCTDCGEET